MTLQNELEAIKLVNAQLERAIGIIANTAGDYTQNIVNDALVEVGYYEEEYDDYEEEED
jgi:hypothetical protein